MEPPKLGVLRLIIMGVAGGLFVMIPGIFEMLTSFAKC